MAQSEQLKIAKIQKRLADQMITRDLVLAVIQNPLVTLLGGTWGLLALQDKYGTEGGFGEFIEKGGAFTAAAGVAAAQALGPDTLQAALKAGTETAGNLIGTIPLLAKGL